MPIGERMKLKRFLLRYYPPGIILEYEQSGVVKSKSIDLLDLRPDSDIGELVQEIRTAEPLVTASKEETVRTLIAKLQQKLGQSQEKKFYLFKVLRAHMLPLTNVAFNKSGARFITGSYDRTCKVWDTLSGEELHTLEGHKNVVYAIGFNNPYGDKIATGSFDKTCKLWSSDTGKCYHTFRGHTAEIVCLSFNPLSTQLATGSMDTTAKVWSVERGSEECTLAGHSAEVVCVNYSTTGDTLLTGSFDHTVAVWDTTTGKRVYTLIGHRGEISNALFNFDSSVIATASMDKTCKLWDSRTGKSIISLRGHEDEILDIAFDYTGHHLVTASADRTARVYNTITQNCLAKLLGHMGEISKVGRATLRALGRDVIVKSLFTVFSGSTVAVQLINSHIQVTFNPQGSRILTASGDKTAKLWDSLSGECIQTLEGHSDEIFSCAFNYEGDTIITGSKDNTCRLWR